MINRFNLLTFQRFNFFALYEKASAKFVRVALVASVGFPLIFASSASAQLPAPAVPAHGGALRLRSSA